MDNYLKRIPQAYKTGAVFLVWSVLVALILQRTPYGIEEGAARALLLVWSAVDHVISPVITLGVPDFRALFFIPAGILWTGQIVPAKVFTVLFMAAAAWSIYAWRRNAGEAESALLATGVLLIAPIVLLQLDTLGVAPYLLWLFACGAWMDANYRSRAQPAFGGWYFAQMVACFIAITLHPAGLGYAATLALRWHQEKNDLRKRRHFFIGIALTVLCALLLSWGWHNTEWLDNPFASLSVLLPMPAFANSIWFASSIVTLALVWVVARKFTALRADFLGSSLLIGLVTGVFAADHAWAVLALTIILYWGFLWLLSVNIPGLSGFFGQRGVAFIVLFVLCISFLSVDRSRYEASREESALTAHDALIETFVQETNATSNANAGIATDRGAAIKVASQWPGQTMLACRCDAYPLPPNAADEQTLLKMLHGIDYLMFDPQNKRNESLVRNLAMLGGEYTEVVAIQTSGVIVQIKPLPVDQNPQNQNAQPANKP